MALYQFDTPKGVLEFEHDGDPSELTGVVDAWIKSQESITPEQPTPEQPWSDIGNRIAASISKGATDTISGTSRIMESMDVGGTKRILSGVRAATDIVSAVQGQPQGQVDKSIAEGRKILGEIGEQAKDTFGVDPRFNQTIASDLAATSGSLVTALASGPLSPVSMAGMMGETQRQEAESKPGTTETQKDVAFAGGATVGFITEKLLGLPALMRAARAAKVPENTFKNLAKTVAIQAAKSIPREGIQEWLDTVGQNIVANQISGYDPKRGTFEGAGKALVLGGVIGGPLGGGIQAAVSIDARKAQAKVVAKEVDSTIAEVATAEPPPILTPSAEPERASEPIPEVTAETPEGAAQAEVVSELQGGELTDAETIRSNEGQIREGDADETGQGESGPNLQQQASVQAGQPEDQIVRSAYESFLEENPEYPDITIAELQKRSGLPLAELHDWIGKNAPNITLSRGDQVYGSEEAKAAALPNTSDPANPWQRIKLEDHFRQGKPDTPADTSATGQIPPTAQPPGTEGQETDQAPEAAPQDIGTGELSAAQLEERLDSAEKRFENTQGAAEKRKIWNEMLELDKQLQKVKSQSVGPGAAHESDIPEPRKIGIKNATIDKLRVERGQAPLMSEARKSFGETWAEAESRIASNENYASELVDQIVKGDKDTISDVEQDAILHEEIKLRNDRDMELDRAGDEYATQEERDAARERAEKIDERIELTDRAARRSGTIAGRALGIRRKMMNDDFTPAAIERRIRAIKGESLTAEEIAGIKADAEKLATEQKKELDREAELENQHAKEQAELALRDFEGRSAIDKRVIEYADRVVRKWEEEAVPAWERLRKRYAVLRATAPEPNPVQDLADLVLVARAWIARRGLLEAEFASELVRDLGDDIEPLVQQAWDIANKQLDKIGRELPERRRKAVQKKIKAGAGTDAERQGIIAGIKAVAEGEPKPGYLDKYIQLLFRNFSDSGMRGLDKITGAVKGVLEPIVPGITERQIQDAFSNYGKSKAAPSDPSKVNLAQIRGEAQKTSALQDILEKREAPKATGQQRVPPSDISRRLTKLINDAKKRYNIQPADPSRALKSALDSRKTYYRNKLNDLRYEIGKRERLVKDKTMPPSDPELEAIKDEYEEVKAQHGEIFGKPELTDEQRLAAALKATARAEGAALKALEDARRGVFPGRKPSRPTSPELEAARARVAQLREETRELQQLTDAFKEQAEQRKIQQAQKSLNELDARIRAGDLTVRSKTTAAMSAERERLVAEREVMVRFLAQLRRDAMPKRSQEEIALQSYKARLAREEADLLSRNARADAGDVTAFEKRKPAPLDLSKDPVLVATKARVQKLKSELNKKANEYRLANRNKLEKLRDGIIQTYNAQKNLVSSLDLSAPRQAVGALLNAPIMTLKRIPGMIKASWSEEYARAQEQKRLSRPNAKNGLDDGVEYTPLDEDSFTKQEENLRSVFDQWAELPYGTGKTGKDIVTSPFKAGSRLIRGSNRAFITFLNNVRADTFDSLMAANFKDSAPTPVQVDALSNMVNLLTGRGAMNPMAAKVASGFLWSPKLLASRIQLLTVAQPLYRAKLDPRASLMVAKIYARVMINGYLLYALSQLFSDKDEKDPVSSDFGKVKIGNTRVDIWGGYQQPAVLGVRLIRGETKSPKTDEVKKIRGEGRKFGDPDATEVAAKFARTKLTPILGETWNLVSGEDVVGNKVTPGSVATNLTIPLSVREIGGLIEDHGIPKATVLQILSSFGAGVNTYDEKEKVSRP